MPGRLSGSEIQIKRQVIDWLFAEVPVVNTPSHITADEIAEEGGAQTYADAAHPRVLHLCDANVKITIL